MAWSDEDIAARETTLGMAYVRVLRIGTGQVQQDIGGGRCSRSYVTEINGLIVDTAL